MRYQNIMFQNAHFCLNSAYDDLIAGLYIVCNCISRHGTSNVISSVLCSATRLEVPCLETS